MLVASNYKGTLCIMVTVLSTQAINETEIEFMLANVRGIWQRFLYRDSILLEAERQKKVFSKEDDWSVELSKLGKEDDVFSTFIQVPCLLFL